MATTEAETEQPNRRDVYDATYSGAQELSYFPRLRSDPSLFHPLPRNLQEFRRQEGLAERKRRLRELWKRLPKANHHGLTTEAAVKQALADKAQLTPERAGKMKEIYEEELLGRCGGHSRGSSPGLVGWKEFNDYVEAKENELWKLFHEELDLDGNGHLDAQELSTALEKAGIRLSPSTLSDFMTTLTSSPHSHAINFGEFRDFLLLLPRKISTAEIYRFYEVKKFLGDDGKGAARVTMEGNVSLSAEDRPPELELLHPYGELPHSHQEGDLEDEDDGPEYLDEEHNHRSWFEGHTALRFLLAGGIAGAVSRTATAPFDRVRIFLITRPPDLGGSPLASKPSLFPVKSITNAITRIYSEGGVLAFWTGNGLSVAKIFPESAIKFYSYESSKRLFAKYWDKVEDPREISGVSRFMSGGIGGIISQLSIYPIETLKTQMMSNTGRQKRTLVEACKHLWGLGGMRAYYRGLTIGLIGVFPYSAIDMSTFEALKLAYARSTGKQEPGVLTVLAFGSVSGSVGAASVYPLNLVRTRLQASGSSGHPQVYTGVWDVCVKTMEKDGWRGFYRGLFPTLARVVPTVSISYVVYEHTKRKLGV